MVRFSLLDTSSRAGGVSLSLPFRTPVGFLFVERRKGDVDRVALVAKVSSSHVAPSLEKMIRRRAFFEPAALREIPPLGFGEGFFSEVFRFRRLAPFLDQSDRLLFDSEPDICHAVAEP